MAVAKESAGKWLGLVLGHEQAGLPALSDVEIADVLKELNLATALEWLAKVNIALCLGGTRNERFQGYVARLLHSQETIQRLIKSAERSGALHVFPFHPGQFRRCMKLVWQNAQIDGGKSPLDDSIAHRLGHVLLCLSSLPPGTAAEPDNSDDSLLHASLLFSQTGYMPRRDAQRVLPIKESMLEPILREPEIGQAFKAAWGLEPSEISGTHLVVVSLFGQGRPDYFNTFGRLSADLRYVFGKSGVSKRAGDWFLKTHVASVTDRPSTATVRAGIHNSVDLRYLVDRPYVEIEDNTIICLDHEFAMSLLARDLFTMANQVVPDLYSIIGPPFEKHVRRILDAAKTRSRGRGIRVVGPLQRPELDAGYQQGGTAVLFETKAGVVRPGDVLAGDVDSVKEQIKNKFIEGRGEAKGFKQLAERVRRVLEEPRAFGLNRPSAIIPVVVTEDEFLANGLVDRWCQAQAKGLFEEFGAKVPGIHLIHGADLIELAYASSDIDLADALLRLSTRGYGVAYNISQWIYDQLPHTMQGQNAEGDGDSDEEERPIIELTILEEGYEKIRKSFYKGFEKPCSKCGEPLTLAIDDKGDRVWLCASCDQRDHPTPTEDEVEAYDSDRRQIIEMYERS